MAAAAHAAGLDAVYAEERPVDVGVTDPTQLVRYRLGQAPFADWLDAIGVTAAEKFAAAAAEAIGDDMQPYQPIVVFLSASSPADRPPRASSPAATTQSLTASGQIGWPPHMRNFFGRHVCIAGSGFGALIPRWGR